MFAIDSFGELAALKSISCKNKMDKSEKFDRGKTFEGWVSGRTLIFLKVKKNFFRFILRNFKVI